MESETMNTQEATETTDSFLDGFDEVEGGVQDQSGETTPEQQSQAQAEESQAQEVAEPPAAEVDTGSEQASQKTTEEAVAGGAQQQATQSPADAPKMWTLRHMEEVQQVGEADMVVLAQKGLDYDRIRGKYDESKPVMELFGTFAKQAGMSIPDYVAYIRTQAKQATGMSEAEARRAVDLEDREAAVAVKEAAEVQRQSATSQAQAAQQAANARRQADIAEFQRTFPDAAKDPKSIPPEVWADVRAGSTLVAAYGKYALALARQAQQAAVHNAAATAKNRVNASRSTGSMQSAGENTGSKDPFMEGWDS